MTTLKLKFMCCKEALAAVVQPHCNSDVSMVGRGVKAKSGRETVMLPTVDNVPESNVCCADNKDAVTVEVSAILAVSVKLVELTTVSAVFVMSASAFFLESP